MAAGRPLFLEIRATHPRTLRRADLPQSSQLAHRAPNAAKGSISLDPYPGRCPDGEKWRNPLPGLWPRKWTPLISDKPTVIPGRSGASGQSPADPVGHLTGL